MYRSHVLVCGGTGCTSSGSQRIRERLEKEIAANGLSEEVGVVKTGCFGLCALGPIMIVYPEGTFYSMVQEDDIPEIVSEHLLKGRVVTRLLYDETTKTDKIIPLNETNFYKKQHRVALRNCGVINPENIEEYIGTGGYEALGIVLTEKTPEDVIQILLDSGLRGRGGAGFPTGLKWKFAAANEADQKYVCCNADEGDPGAFMDRSILEGDPHAVLEAMAIAGYAIGASQGYIYVRAEYPIAVKRLEIAINQAREYGLLGENIFDSFWELENRPEILKDGIVEQEPYRYLVASDYDYIITQYENGEVGVEAVVVQIIERELPIRVMRGIYPDSYETFYGESIERAAENAVDIAVYDYPSTYIDENGNEQYWKDTEEFYYGEIPPEDTEDTRWMINGYDENGGRKFRKQIK